MLIPILSFLAIFAYLAYQRKKQHATKAVGVLAGKWPQSFLGGHGDYASQIHYDDQHGDDDLPPCDCCAAPGQVRWPLHQQLAFTPLRPRHQKPQTREAAFDCCPPPTPPPPPPPPPGRVRPSPPPPMARPSSPIAAHFPGWDQGQERVVANQRHSAFDVERLSSCQPQLQPQAGQFHYFKRSPPRDLSISPLETPTNPAMGLNYKSAAHHPTGRATPLRTSPVGHYRSSQAQVEVVPVGNHRQADVNGHRDQHHYRYRGGLRRPLPPPPPPRSGRHSYCWLG